jgi:hypothetical protein
LKSRIDQCQKGCASLKDNFQSRLNLDTNIQTKHIRRTLNAIKDDKLGTFELHSSNNLIIICSIHPARDVRQWLAAPDSSKNRNEARDKYQDNTCAWFLEGERFREWQEKPGFLWIKGKRKFLLSSVLNLHV